MKFFAYANRGTAEFSYAAATLVERDKRVQAAYNNWMGAQPKGSKHVVADMIGNRVPVTVEVTYE